VDPLLIIYYGKKTVKKYKEFLRYKKGDEKNQEDYNRASSHSVIASLCLDFAFRITKENSLLK